MVQVGSGALLIGGTRFPSENRKDLSTTYQKQNRRHLIPTQSAQPQPPLSVCSIQQYTLSVPSVCRTNKGRTSTDPPGSHLLRAAAHPLGAGLQVAGRHLNFPGGHGGNLLGHLLGSLEGLLGRTLHRLLDIPRLGLRSSRVSVGEV